MAELTESQIRQSLDGLAGGLAADGYKLCLRAADGRVEIEVQPTEGACADCLVPMDVMRSIAVSMINGAGGAYVEDDVTVIYPDGSAAH